MLCFLCRLITVRTFVSRSGFQPNFAYVQPPPPPAPPPTMFHVCMKKKITTIVTAILRNALLCLILSQLWRKIINDHVCVHVIALFLTH